MSYILRNKQKFWGTVYLHGEYQYGSCHKMPLKYFVMMNSTNTVCLQPQVKIKGISWL